MISCENRRTLFGIMRQIGGLYRLVVGKDPARSRHHDAAAFQHLDALHQNERAADVLLTMSL
jgi:hypothetical protein